MAKAIEEICKDLAEWQKENQKERNVLLIAGYKNNIQININGSKVPTCVALAIANSIETRKLIQSAVYLAGGNPEEEEE